MSESLFLHLHDVHLLKRLALVLSLAAMAGLAACGGGSSSSFQEPPPVNTNNVCSTTPFSGNPAGGAQPNPFFGMHIHSLAPGTPWPDSVVPSVQFGGLRLWDSGTGWAEMNTSAGVCDFSHMDSWLTEAQANNVDVLYNLGRTPNWASSNPSDSSCSYAYVSSDDGQCDPPYDLNPDGTGTNDIWIGWVTSVVNHYKGKVKFYEIWNEWNISLFWKGTPQQLVRMTQDAYCIIEGPPAGGCNSNSTFHGTGLDPSAQVITPSSVGAGTSSSELDAAASNMATFLGSQAGGMGPGNFIDIIGFHCYVSTKTVGDYPIPENAVIVDNNVAAVSGVQGKPLFCTEGGWGDVSEEGFTDTALQAAFLARYYLVQSSTSVQRVYWYAWDTTSNDIALWSPTDTTPAAIAYGEVYEWINGATLSSPCAPISGSTVYTCTYTRSGGYTALAVWDSNPDSSCYTNGAPTCSTFTIPSQYKLYRDLSGNETSVPGATISLTAQPILLETSALP